MPLIVLSPSRLLSISDGDTPEVKMGVRLLGMDAPELHFPEGRDVARCDGLLAKLSKTAAFKKLPESLRTYLLPRLEGAGTRQKAWGLKSLDALERLRAGLPRKASGNRPPFFLAIPPGAVDRYGRLLAYMGPWTSREERKRSGPPETFNLKMLRAGWAAPYLHRANLPKKKDLGLAVKAVRTAMTKKLGIWADLDLLLPYEFRACVRMALGQGGFSYSVQDLRTLGKKSAKTLPSEAYIEIPVEYRVFG